MTGFGFTVMQVTRSVESETRVEPVVEHAKRNNNSSTMQAGNWTCRRQLAAGLRVLPGLYDWTSEMESATRMRSLPIAALRCLKLEVAWELLACSGTHFLARPPRPCFARLLCRPTRGPLHSRRRQSQLGRRHLCRRRRHRSRRYRPLRLGSPIFRVT